MAKQIEQELLLKINETNKKYTDMAMQYFFKLHTMLITQTLMLRAVMIKTGFTAKEVDSLMEKFSAEAQSLAEEVFDSMLATAGKPPK